MQLILSNAQGELSPLERGKHALEATEKGKHKHSVNAYAERVGRPPRTVDTEVCAARVSQICSCEQISVLVNRTRHLAEIQEMWMSCYAQEEIAEKAGWDQSKVARFMQDRQMALLHKTDTPDYSRAKHIDEAFDRPLYNVWKQQEKTCTLTLARPGRRTVAGAAAPTGADACRSSHQIPPTSESQTLEVSHMADNNVLTELKSFQGSLNKEIAEHKQTLDQHSEKLRLNDLHFDQLEAQLNRPDIPDGWSRRNLNRKSFAEQIIGHPQFEAMKRIPHGRYFFPLESSAFPAEMEQKVILSTGLVRPAYEPEIVAPGTERFRIRALLRRVATTSSIVEFMREVSFGNNASPQVEGLPKSESNIVWEKVQRPIETLAHYVKASRQALDDVAPLQDYIDRRLLDGLRDKEDQQILAGDGIGENILGLIPQAAAYNTGQNVAGDTFLDKLNHALSQLELSKLEPTGIILNPRDWRKIELIKTEEGGANKGDYILGQPRTGTGPMMLWNTRVLTSTAMPANSFLIGDFSYCTLYDRQSATIDVSFEDGDNFVRNLVTIRCEERIGVAVERSDCLVYGVF